jgi:[ribosomal protein S5]-alanine N-acetyltransferase
MYPVTLTGRAVQLREFRMDDAASTLAIIGDTRVTQWLSFDNRDHAAAVEMMRGATERAQRDPRTEYYLAVTLPDTDQLVGFVRLGLSGVKVAKLGYAITADHWGNGYASDAALTIVRFGFAELRLHRISAAIGPDNIASVTIAERLGMRYEGRIRDHVFTNGPGVTHSFTPSYPARRGLTVRLRASPSMSVAVQYGGWQTAKTALPVSSSIPISSNGSPPFPCLRTALNAS